MKKLKAIIHIIFSSEYFVAVSNNLNNDKKPTTFTYYIDTNRKTFAVTIKDFLKNICFEE
jgi:hypothetical protein